MKIGIDSYCFHRYFGEVYDNQKNPGQTISYEDFLNRAIELNLAGVSLETCFFKSTDESYLKQLKEIMDRGGLECIVAWGHPMGLEGGNPDDWFYQACTPIGQGTIDIPALIKTLDTSGYDGLYAIEFDYLDPKYQDEDSALVASVDYLRSLNG